MATRAKLPIPTKGKFRLIKWDCDTAPEKETENPQQDPRCREIIEWEMGGPKKTIYKKEE